jgi:hypothetical protein
VGIEFSLTADGIGTVFTSSGLLTGQDLLDVDARLHEEVQRNPAIRYLLVDHSAIPEERVDSEAIRELAKRTAKNLEVVSDGIVAIVAPNDVLFGLSRMWEIQAEQPNLLTRVMRTRTEAIAWLEEELRQRQLPFLVTE